MAIDPNSNMDACPSPPEAGEPLASLQARLARLPFLDAQIVIEPLAGGITNRNFRVRGSTGTFAVRLCEPRPWLGIDRRNESLCQDFAATLGLAPAAVYREPDMVITTWIEGQVLTASDAHQTDVQIRIVADLKRLHSAGDQLPGAVLDFCPFETVHAYIRTAQQQHAALPDTLPGLLSKLDQLHDRITPFRPVLCHNDLLPANWIDDGTRLWLLDWEYAGIGHPFFDLANLSANTGLGDLQDDQLLTAYLSSQPTHAQRTEFRIFKAVSFLRESLWGSIQSVSSDIDFDYIGYAQTNYDAFLVQLGST